MSERFLYLRRSERDMIINIYYSSCTAPFILVRVNETRIFGKNFENTQKPNFMKICPVEAELVHADIGHTNIQS